MNAFELVRPTRLEEALEVLSEDPETVRPFGGGTALMLLMRSRLLQPRRLVSLDRVSGLDRLDLDGEGNLRVGSMVRLRDLELSATVERFCPAISRALLTLSNVRVRNVATVGGHLAHGDPHMDLPPILLALGASVVAQGPAGPRQIPLDQLYLGYYATSLQPGELITELVIPPLPEGTRGSYLKATALSADDWPMAGVAAFFRLEQGRIVEPRIAVSAATTTPVRLPAVEAALAGEAPSEALFSEAGRLAGRDLHCLSDLRGSAAYKREVVRVYVRRALQQVWAGR
ncbi:MAG: xanthine dehydrogenase family protein subunit M [Firmicutes bacterium]|nr:xanthine dehydrogenase family protein subunit M [Bacillota bacterium]